MRLRQAIPLVLSACAAFPVFSQTPGTDTRTRIADPRFRTLQTTNADNFMGMPVVRLGSEDRMLISFDELGDDISYLQYRLLHCNSDWTRSSLVESEYLDGFNVADITDYAFSSNTYVHYVNYRIEVPNADMRPLKSGNYLLQVFPQDNPEELVLQTRFCVSENTVAVAGEATSRTDRGLNTEWQQVNLTVNPGEFQIRSPFTDIVLIVSQNGHPDRTRTLTHPQQIKGRTLVYEHCPDLIFPAGNEYRRFETVRADYPGMNVDSVKFIGRNYHAWVHTDRPRAESSYIYDLTQNGRFKIDEYNATDPDLGADYITVHFELKHPEIMNADVFVDGNFAYDSFSDANRMHFDPASRSYRLDIPVKQGSYHSQYVAVPRKDPKVSDPAIFEGNKFETGNEYQVYVYLREPGTRADRLIGTAQLFSR